VSAVADPPAPATPRQPARVLDVAPYDVAAARALERELSVSPVLAQILARRGLGDVAAARRFLAAADEHPPSDCAGMAEGVGLVLRHVRAGTRITVHGDYDVDGVCSTALLVRALRALGGDADWVLPSRTEDGYGLAAATVDRLAERGTRLLLAVDCGVTAVEEVARARARGLDVLVCDHHAPRADGVVPDALIVHPALGGYPCPELCATGVAHKLVAALAEAASAGPDLSARDLDLVALATVADVVPLRGENRRLVRDGLRAMARTRSVGLRALMEVARLDPGQLDAAALGFRLGPRINAAGRLGRADAGVELLLCDDEQRAREIAAELDAANAERRATEQRMEWEAEAAVGELGPRPAYVLWGEGWHPGVVGIVASRIAERHHRPAVVIALGVDGGATGSGRSIPGFDLLGGLHACAEHLGRYGGHRAAAGLTVAPPRLEALRAAFEAHAAAVLRPEDLVPRERVDAVVSGDALGLPLADELARLEPCGMGNPGVTLLVRAARCVDVRSMGEDGRHVRFTVEAGGSRARAVRFGCAGRLDVGEGEPCDLTFRLERREWNGAVEARLLLREARASAPPPVAVVGEPPAERWLAAALAPEPGGAPPGVTVLSPREQIDRRATAPAGVLADLVGSGDPVLAVVADVGRRLPGLAQRLGGFSLCSWAALEDRPELAALHRHVVVLDPPAGPLPALPGGGFTHLAWGEEEVRFARANHELEYDLRLQLAALFRAVRGRGRIAGDDLAALLRGPGEIPRSTGRAGRLVRILSELGLVAVERDPPALELLGAERTDLERSPTWRAACERLEEGRRWLSGVTSPQAA
jgi:single-stranded-DNA-specific exonuclease